MCLGRGPRESWTSEWVAAIMIPGLEPVIAMEWSSGSQILQWCDYGPGDRDESVPHHRVEGGPNDYGGTSAACDFTSWCRQKAQVASECLMSMQAFNPHSAFGCCVVSSGYGPIVATVLNERPHT